ncbi:GGDEF domain-containing protein [Microbacterium sp. zg-YB36]|uniref:GGDEF domain-containing protein n=1 Tax=Microbacterium sp. zg-YB36 TaxID=2969407 RepID=UPI00214CCB16|nr:GGDEF domain-containing protein [Microbacterium sp. zg-YB36]MDL5352767.1 GGDEF domain-containing protein [Microbacterium sp. zg-YB36]
MTTATVDGSVILAVLATLTSMMMIGLGFLYRPSVATLLWSLMFLLVMISSFGVLISDATGMPTLAEVSEGVVMAAPAFVWSGLRVARGARGYMWVGPLVAAVAATALATSIHAPWHSLIYSTSYLLASTWAALSVLELIRRHEHDASRLLPLLIVSGVLPLIGIASVVAAIVNGLSGNVEHVLPDLKAIGVIAYLTCALVSLLGLARNPVEAGTFESGEFFPHTARDRLARAEAAGETTWSLIALSLDDTDALRIAGGEDAFRRIVDRLGADVRASFPADSDIGGDGGAGFLVLLSRPETTVRDCIRDLLERVSTVQTDQPLAVEFSASAGSASVRTHGYDLDALVTAAQTAMDRARAAGGHRWSTAGAV